jgi:hypothetical protein
MFTVSSLSGDAERPFGRIKVLTGRFPASTVRQEAGSGYPQRHCTSVGLVLRGVVENHRAKRIPACFAVGPQLVLLGKPDVGWQVAS